MIRYYQDLYPRTDPKDGARLVRFTKQQLTHYLHQRNGTGSGKVALRGTTSDAAFISPLGLDYVREVRVNTAVVDGATLSGFGEKVVGGYFLEEGDFLALSRRLKKLLTLQGAGTLSVLDREIMWSHSYLTTPFIGTDPQPEGWPLHLAGTGNALGAILWRVITEGQGFENPVVAPDDRTESAIGMVTMTFDYEVDSDGNPWTVTSGDFFANVGESVLSVTKRLMEAGLYIEMDPDTFELSAWEIANHGRDRTGPAWGADVLRFEPPTDQVADNGNILSDLKRALRAIVRVSKILAGGAGVYATADGTTDVPWHRFYPSEAAETGALIKVAERQVGAREDAGDTVLVRIKVGNDPANGRYLVGEHALTDDLATLNTGAAEWEWDEDAYPVAAWSVTTRRSGAPDAFVHLGAIYHSTGDRQFQAAQHVGPHTHPPNPRLCNSSELLEGLTALKGSGAQVTPAAPRTNANDGDDSTPWGSGEGEPSIGVAGEWWAADLGSPKMVGTYRIRQQGGGFPDVQNVATEVGIYGTTDPDLWAALPASGKLTDPAASGWRLLASYSGALAYSDVTATFTPGGARYVIFWAEAGGTLDWDVETFELWSYVGTSGYASRCDHEHPATEEEDDAVAAGDQIVVPHLLTAHVFPIIAHHGDMNPVDGWPENVEEGYLQAMMRGAHGVEIDVQRSADGTWYAFHDFTVTRTTDGTGNFIDKTDAQVAALNIDGGLGYDAGRHGTSLNVPTLDAVLDAVLAYDPLIWFDLKEDVGVDGITPGAGHAPAAAALAEYIIANELTQRSVIVVYDIDGADAVKAVRPTLPVAFVTIGSGEDIETEPNVDRLYSLHTLVVDTDFVTNRAPKPVDAWPHIDEWGNDELAMMTDMWERGARSWTTNDVAQAMIYRHQILIGAGVGASALDDLTDVTITSPATLDRIHYNGSAWVNTVSIWRPLMDGAGNVVTDGGTGEAVMALS